jgi:hypothetical protein
MSQCTRWRGLAGLAERAGDAGGDGVSFEGFALDAVQE